MVSVVIPTKNEEKVFKAVEKVREQGPDEIIVVNDPDSSEDYTDRLRGLEDVTYLECGDGVAASRNLGAEEAESDKVVFLDADCYPKENWLEKIEEGLEEDDVVEGTVEYVGDRCPFNKIVENRVEEGRFLTANLGVRKEVFTKVRFDEEYGIFREDTDFGLRAKEEGFSTSFVDAAVEHDAGRYTFRSFIQDRLRHVSEPYFYNKFREDEQHLEVSSFGPVLYPVELAAAFALAATVILGFSSPYYWLGTGLFSVLLSAYYTSSKMRNKDAEFCLKDFLKGFYWVPIGLLAKRYAIWKGALKYNVLVV